MTCNSLSNLLICLQDGVNWLGFLNKYKLHGVLCDDMGLGKTLQSICIMASDHHSRQQKYKVAQHRAVTGLQNDF